MLKQLTIWDIMINAQSPKRTSVNQKVYILKEIISRYSDVRCRDINNLTLECAQLKEWANHFQIGYLPKLIFISMERHKVIPTRQFIDGFIRAASGNRRSYKGYLFME